MNIDVRYYSKSGNTKKIADAIAKQAGVSAKLIHEPIQGEVDMLFLGIGLYAFDIDPELKEYNNYSHSSDSFEYSKVANRSFFIDSGVLNAVNILEKIPCPIY